MDEAPRTTLRRSRRLPLVILAVVLAGAGALTVLLLEREPEAPPEGPPQAAAPAEPAPELAIGPGPGEQAVDAAGAKPLLEGVSGDPLFRMWLEGAELLRRCVLAIDNVAEGVSPRVPLAALAPASPFSVEHRGDGFVIAPESYARYDAFGGAVESLDTAALASAYRRLHGALESAYRALGYPTGSLDRTVARALNRIENAPVAKGDVPVESQDGVWTFSDPGLEKLRAVEKHLLRMGPRNTLRLQAKARELREALQLPAQLASGVR